MVDTTVFILHYSDIRCNPKVKSVSNLVLNELLLRCVQSIKRNTVYPHKLVIVDNGSPEQGHEDAIQLLKEYNLTVEFLWVQEEWHPVAVGVNRAMDSLETDYMVLITSDMKPGKGWLAPMIEPLKTKEWHMTACEPNITLYGINDPDKYRTPLFWEFLKHKNASKNVFKYFVNNGVKVELDEWEEPVPICKPYIKDGNQRISIFSASRDFIDKVGRYDEAYLRACEYQYYFQAIKNGIEKPTSEASYSYLSHFGGLFRVGVGSYNGVDIEQFSPKGDLRFKRGKGNVFTE